MGRVKDRKVKVKALQCLAVAALLVIFCSCLSFDIGDWPSKFVYPHNKPAANWCGPVGAMFAYNLLYYTGPGIFVVLISCIYFMVVKIAEQQTSEPILRFIGLILVTTAASATFYCFSPHGLYGFPMGSGGVLGVAAASTLRSHFATLGTTILLGTTWIVGMILLADQMVAVVFGWLGFAVRKMAGFAAPKWATAAAEQSKALGQIWQRLSIRQKAEDRKQKTEDGMQNAELNPQDKPGGLPVSTASPELKPVTLKKPSMPYEPPSYDDYTMPGIELLDEPEKTFASVQEKVVKHKAVALEGLLGEFDISAAVVAAETGPVVTMFELQLAAGVKVSQISSLSNDIARALGVGAVRIVAPLPGKHTIGVEVPNSEKERVRMKDMLRLAGNRPAKMAIPLFLGKDSSGDALVEDLSAMPHLLIAGTTGSGKSICINSDDAHCHRDEKSRPDSRMGNY
jgi:S-DNA-T family DNA segregation ATPase FtsK/SpoIIIE